VLGALQAFSSFWDTNIEHCSVMQQRGLPLGPNAHPLVVSRDCLSLRLSKQPRLSRRESINGHDGHCDVDLVIVAPLDHAANGGDVRVVSSPGQGHVIVPW